MKKLHTYKGYTITSRTSDGHCALIFSGTGYKINSPEIQQTTKLVKCIAGEIIDGVCNAVDKAKTFIDNIGIATKN